MSKRISFYGLYFFDKKNSTEAIAMLQNEQLAEKLYKPIIRKFQKAKVYSLFHDNIWGGDLADMQLISKFDNFIKCY